MRPLLYSSPAIACAELACQRAAANVHAQLKRRLRSLAVIASTAPLFGVVGTLFGILGCFVAFDGSKESGMAFVAGHLSNAMFPILVALLVAIPAYWLYQYLSNQLQLFATEMENETARLVNRLIVHVQRTPHSVREFQLPIVIDHSAEVSPGELHLLLDRIWRHGLAELIWPNLTSRLDSDTSLQLARIICFVYAILGWLTYAASHRPWAAIVIFCFFSACGIGLRAGSYFAAIGILTFVVIACSASAATYGWTFGTVCLAISPLFLLGWWKAMRAHSLAKPCPLFPTIALATFLPAALLAVLFDTALSLNPLVADTTMEPAIHFGEAVVSLSAPVMGPVQRGDIISTVGTWWAQGAARVVGVPGDRIRVLSGKLIRNGKSVTEQYVQKAYTSRYGDFPLPSSMLPEDLRWQRDNAFARDWKNDEAYTVPEGSYFLLNDDRNAVQDSRIFGPIPESCIAGRPILAFAHNSLSRWPRRITN